MRDLFLLVEEESGFRNYINTLTSVKSSIKVLEKILI